MIHNPDLTASELGSIWSSYMADSMNICIMKHFLANVEDQEIKEILQYSKDLSEGHIKTLTKIFEKENLPIPQGYSNVDVVETAPRLFSDIFYIRYLQFMGRTGTNLNGMALGTSYRDDVRSFYLATVRESGDLYDRIIKLQEEKGILVRTPYVSYHKKVEFVEDDHFLAGYLTLNKRPLLAVEINHLSNNIELNVIGRILADGLAQVTKTKEVIQLLQEGYELATEIIKTLEMALEYNHTDTPFSSDSAITDSTTAPFSDKLIMGLASLMTTVSIGNIGQAIGASVRSDLIGEYSQLVPRVLKFGNDTAKISIKNGWLEKPPQTIDRKELQNKR